MAGVMDLIWPGAFVAQSIHVVDRLRAKILDGLLLIPFHAASELDDYPHGRHHSKATRPADPRTELRHPRQHAREGGGLNPGPARNP